MKRIPGILGASDPNPRIYDGATASWYSADTLAEKAYTGTQLASNRAAAVTANAVNNTGGYSIGALYYGEWKTPGLAYNPAPWSRLQKAAWAGRKPLLGYFSDDAQWVIDEEIKIAASYGIDFFAFDFYWSNSNTTKNEHTIYNFMASPNKALMKFCLLVANHTDWPNSLTVWRSMVDYWITNFFADPQYQKIGGKPVIYLFSPDDLRKKGLAMSAPQSLADLLADARSRAVTAGYSGIHFVGCTDPHKYWVGAGKALETAGFDAMSAYNWHYRWGSVETDWNWNSGYPFQRSATYSERATAYQVGWDWISNSSGATIPIYLPITAGWDDRPWWAFPNVNTTDGTDKWWNCAPNINEWTQHLLAAKTFMDSQPSKTSKTCLIYAWNEYGEGGYIAPTEGYGVSLLEKIKSTFKSA